MATGLRLGRHLSNSIVIDEPAISRAMARKLADFFDHPIEFYVDQTSKAA